MGRKLERSGPCLLDDADPEQLEDRAAPTTWDAPDERVARERQVVVGQLVGDEIDDPAAGPRSDAAGGHRVEGPAGKRLIECELDAVLEIAGAADRDGQVQAVPPGAEILDPVARDRDPDPGQAGCRGVPPEEVGREHHRREQDRDEGTPERDRPHPPRLPARSPRTGRRSAGRPTIERPEPETGEVDAERRDHPGVTCPSRRRPWSWSASASWASLPSCPSGAPPRWRGSCDSRTTASTRHGPPDRPRRRAWDRRHRHTRSVKESGSMNANQRRG